MPEKEQALCESQVNFRYSTLVNWYLYTIVRIIALASYFLFGQVAVEHYLSRMSSGTKASKRMLLGSSGVSTRVRLARLDSPMRKFAFGSSIERGVAGSFDRIMTHIYTHILWEVRNDLISDEWIADS